MQLLTERFLEIADRLANTIDSFGINSSQTKDEFHLLSSECTSGCLMISQLEKISPVLLCEKGMALIGINESEFTPNASFFILKFSHPDSILKLFQQPERYAMNKENVFSEIVKIDSNSGKWSWYYSMSKFLSISENGETYILSLGIDIEEFFSGITNWHSPELLAAAVKIERSDVLGTLTLREKDILKCILNNLTNAEIAENLFISNHTVHSHRKNIMRKLGVKSGMELARFAMNSDLMNS